MRYANLEQFIKNTNVKQKDLAKRLGITQGHLSLLVYHKRLPSFQLAMKIRRITGIPIVQSLSGKL